MPASCSQRRAARLVRLFCSQVPVLAGAAAACSTLFAESGETAHRKIEDALNVFDFETVARKKVPPAHWGYLATGRHDGTIKANRDGFKQLRLARPAHGRCQRRRHEHHSVRREVRFADRTVARELSTGVPSRRRGGGWESGQGGRSLANVVDAHVGPIEDVNRGARLQGLVSALLDRPVGRDRRSAEARHDAGCTVAMTVDLNGGSNRETLARLRRADTRDCTLVSQVRAVVRALPGQTDVQGIDMSKVRSTISKQ